jgi:hypothetical protein
MFHITEEQANFWDSFCKVIGLIGLLLGGVWTVGTYLDNKATADTLADHNRLEAARTASREARKPFLDKKLELYTQAAKIVATIGTADTNTRQEAVKEFWVLHWGDLAIVEDSDVQASMEDVAKCLRQRPQCNAAQIRTLGKALTRDLKKSISRDWDVSLAPDTSRTEPPE